MHETDRQQEILAMIANGTPLADVLVAVCRAIEQKESGLAFAFVLAAEEGQQTGLSVCSCLPDSFACGLQALGMRTSDVAPCVRTLQRGEVVLVPDVSADRRFDGQWRDLLTRHRLSSCSSLPVLGQGGRVLASFCAYGREPNAGARASEQIIETFTRLAAIAIALRRAEEALRREQEVTAAQDAQLAVREAERRFRIMADSSPVLIWQTDEQGVTYINSRYLGFFGQPFESVARMGWTKFLHPDDAGYLAACQVAFARRQPYDRQARFRRHDGEYRWLHSVATPHYGPDGAYVGFIGCSFDVSDIRRAADELKEAERKKDEFLATLAHELRNPLAPIRNGLQIMKLAGADIDTITTVRLMMERQLVQMARLIDDLMDLSRINRGNIVLRKERMQLTDAVRDAVETVRPLLDERSHELLLAVPAEAIYLHADRTRLSQVFANLLSNAAKYTANGGRIALGIDRRCSEAVVSVEDNGIGIPPHMLGGVFRMFSQIERSYEKSEGGLGVGLYLVKRLVELHGGGIEAQSRGLGAGSRFVVRLPIESPPGDSEPKLPDGKGKRRLRHRIMVVDDNWDAADSLATWLEMTGNETRAAHDGFEALAIGAVFRPDVVLLDIGMPKLNGFDACRRIRQEPWGAGIVIVACTGWGQDAERRLSREAGFDFHLVKPVDPAELEKLLEALPVIGS